MATELTFQPGRVPGLARRAPRPLGDVPAVAFRPMSCEQRTALRELIHTPARISASRFSRADAVAGIAWMVVTACALAWTLVIANALVPSLGIALSIEIPCVA
jgi:hypothetical protein